MKKTMLFLPGIFLLILLLNAPVTAWTEDLDNGLVFYHSFEETFGDYIDSVSGKHNGVVAGVTMGVDGKIDKAGKFGGIGSKNHVNISDSTDFIVTAFTISFWINVSSTASLSRVIYHFDGTTNDGFFLTISDSGKQDKLTSAIFVNPSFIYLDSDTIITNDTWYHFVMRRFSNGTGEMWLNGVRQADVETLGGEIDADSVIMLGADVGTGTQEFNGTLDEMGFWNRSLTDSEISDLYNGGNGTKYIFPSPLTVNLISPPDYYSTDFFNRNINLIANYSALNLSFTNATYYVWNSTNDVYNSTSLGITGDTTNSTTLNMDFIAGDFSWNVEACGIESNGSTFCNFAKSNYSISILLFLENSQTFNSTAYETSSESFLINLSYDSNYYPGILANLIYDGVPYTGVKSGEGNNVVFSSSISIPPVQEPTNLSFYWQIAVINGSEIEYLNSSSNIQAVDKIYFAVCNATYTVPAFNFTAYDEKNLSRIDLFNFYATFNYGFQTKNLTFSVNNKGINETVLCLSPPDLSFYADGIIEYNFEDENITHTTRNYYFQNALVSNNTQEINLYLLNAEDSTSFIIKVQDQKLSAIKGAFVYIQRYYPLDGTYKTVQIAKTDDNGETIGFYETEIVDYKHLVIKDGVVLLETSPQKVVGKEVPFTLTFTVGESLIPPWEYWKENPNIQTSLIYNDTTKIVTFIYIDITGATTFGKLLVVQESPSNYTSAIICDSNSTQSSAVLTCNMTEYTGNFIAKGIIETEDNIVKLINFIISTAKEILDRTGLIIGWFIILTAGMAFIWNPTAGVVGINAAMWFVNIIGLVTFSYVFLFAIMGVSIIAIILLKT